jgi:hypothetical protein
VAELIRRRPDAAREPVLADQGSWEEFTGTELSHALADTRWAADTMLDLAHTLATKLPGTYAAFRTGILPESKAAIIARAVTNLNPAEARAAEAKVLDRAGQLTPGGLRAAITHAIIEVAPDKARKRRSTPLERRADHPGHLPVDRPVRTPLHHRTNPLPHLTGFSAIAVLVGYRHVHAAR